MRLATFAHAISKTNPTDPSNAMSAKLLIVAACVMWKHYTI